MLCINVKRSLLGIKLKGRIVHNTSTNRLWLDQVLDGYWYSASHIDEQKYLGYFFNAYQISKRSLLVATYVTKHIYFFEKRQFYHVVK